MAATQAASGYGIKVEIGDGATPTEAFLTVGELVDMGDFANVLNMANGTHMQSPDGYMESVPTFKQMNDLTLTVNYVPADTGFLECKTALENREKRNFRVTLPTASDRRFDFAAYVRQHSFGGPHDNIMRGSIVLAIQGKPVELAGDGDPLA